MSLLILSAQRDGLINTSLRARNCFNSCDSCNVPLLILSTESIFTGLRSTTSNNTTTVRTRTIKSCFPVDESIVPGIYGQPIYYCVYQ